MTILRKDPDALSNWFNAILHGAGHRNSSFCDVDSLIISALTHDEATRRFLFQEFKRPEERCSLGQWKALYDLARQPRTTVWIVRQGDDMESVSLKVLREVRRGELIQPEILSTAAYRERFEAWWNGESKPVMTDIRMDWPDYLDFDPSLRAFVDAEIARAGVSEQAARAEAARYQRMAEALQQRVNEFKRKRKP